MKINLVQASINTSTLRLSTFLDVNRHPKYNYSPHLLYNNKFQSCFLAFKLIEHLSIQKLNSIYFSPSWLNNSLQKVIYMQKSPEPMNVTRPKKIAWGVLQMSLSNYFSLSRCALTAITNVPEREAGEYTQKKRRWCDSGNKH